MAEFPVLKSGATSQYPLERTVRFRTSSVQFLDGSSQRFPLQRGPLRSWAIHLDLLDASELQLVLDFAEEKNGSVFSFTDPATGQSVAKCTMAEGAEALLTGEWRNSVRLTIQEVL